MPVTCTNYKLKCGGCPLLNQPYPDQLKHKQQLEQRLLGRFAPVSPVLGQAEPWHYRNKAIATFATGPRGRLTCGIYAAGTHRVLPYTDCLLQDTVINQTIAAVLEAARACRWPAFEEDRGIGLLRHVLVRRGKTSGQVLVVLVTAQENLPGSRNFVKALREKAPWVTSVVQNCNPRRTSAVLGSDVRTLYGPGKITDTLCGLQFAISPRSFYQVNPEQTEVLYAKAIEFAALTGKETVIDAYCGIGTIGKRVGNAQLMSHGRHIGMPKLRLAGLRDMLGSGEMRHAIRDGLGHTRHHVAHVNVGHEVAKQERVAIPHDAREGAAILKQPLAMRDMYVPGWHTSIFSRVVVRPNRSENVPRCPRSGRT